jgi:hypothetical protein
VAHPFSAAAENVGFAVCIFSFGCAAIPPSPKLNPAARASANFSVTVSSNEAQQILILKSWTQQALIVISPVG